MAVLDLSALEPTKISRDLKGKYVLIYSLPKKGKTTLASHFPKNLILGFEVGWHGLSNIKAVPIQTWADFKAYVKQLRKKEIQEMYDTITIDTAQIAWDRCVDYICSVNDVDKIGDIPYGGGYAETAKEYEKTIREITTLGYGLVIIAHSTSKTFASDTEEGAVTEKIGPNLAKRPYDIINQMVDIIGYIQTDKDNNRYLCLRETPEYVAGSRFAHMPEKIPLGYQELADALAEAIEQEGQSTGMITDESQVITQEDKSDFKDVVKSIKKYAVAFKNAEKMNLYEKVVASYLGKNKGVKECTENQLDILVLILDDLKDVAEQNELKV